MDLQHRLDGRFSAIFRYFFLACLWARGVISNENYRKKRFANTILQTMRIASYP